jgi:hypothetical protein
LRSWGHMAVCKAYCDANGISYSDATRLSMLRSVLGDIGKYYFKPSAGCQVIMDDARARNTFVAKSQAPKPGYLVVYNWSGHDNAEHIGIVDQPVPTASKLSNSTRQRMTALTRVTEAPYPARNVR